MKFKIDLSPSATNDIVEAAGYIALDSPENAERWLIGIHTVIQALKVLPQSQAQAREAIELKRDFRQTVFKSHRIIFSIDQYTIQIHRVIHTAQDNLKTIE